MINPNYRFQLKPYKTGSKIRCPQCGKRSCFTIYIDTLNEISFPNYVGRCDHESSCGYHYKPSQFFNDNPQFKANLSENNRRIDEFRNVKPIQVSLPEPSFIDDIYLRRSLKGIDKNPLFKWISGWFGIEDSMKLFDLYKVGTSVLWGGSTVFWQIDLQNKVRAGKIMAYDPNTGHRIKDDNCRVTWVHSYLKLNPFNLRQCFFGEHLFSMFPDKTIAIVESEKSALIAAHFMPELLWIATGGSNGCFNSEAVKSLQNRTVLLVPDLGMTEKWRQKLELLKPICNSVFITDRLEKIASPEQIERGLDIADFLEEFSKSNENSSQDQDKSNEKHLQSDGKSRKKHFEITPEILKNLSEKPPVEWSDEEVLANMMLENPALKTMVEELELELIPSDKSQLAGS